MYFFREISVYSLNGVYSGRYTKKRTFKNYLFVFNSDYTSYTRSIVTEQINKDYCVFKKCSIPDFILKYLYY